MSVRKGFHPERLDLGSVSDAESYTYSAVWLLSGIALLAAGVFLKRQPMRMISAALIVLVVLKVFLLDMANLTGIWRALSFIGLGGVLVAIGLFYQRFLSVPTKRKQESAENE